jgi:hypothetical protein
VRGAWDMNVNSLPWSSHEKEAKTYATSNAVLPGWVINIALLIHSDEALLAVGFIFAIHFFNTQSTYSTISRRLPEQFYPDCQ